MSVITAVFADPLTTTRNAKLLAKRAGVPLKSAESFLREQEAAQVRRRAHKPSAASFSPTGDVYGTWAADVMFLNDYAGLNGAKSCVLTLLELNSRYVYARALTKVTSAKTAEAMESILEQNDDERAEESKVAPIMQVRTDNGSEFAGDFAKLLASYEIPHDRAEAETHARLARLDRFHRTLRHMIGELFALRGSHVWADVLPMLIKNYNERPSRSLVAAGEGLAPADIGPEEEQAIRDDDMDRATQVGSSVDRHGVKVGTRVRLLFSRMKAGARQIQEVA